MRILICDTNLFYIKELKAYLNTFFQLHDQKTPEILSFYSAETLLQDTGRKDIVFIDPALPGIDGIALGQELRTRYPNMLLFVISGDISYLDDAMRLRTFRYLQKPIDCSRLYQNLEDALHLLMSMHTDILVETKETVYKIITSDIICVEALQGKVIVHTKNKDYLSIRTMKHWTDTLTANYFFQSHRSFIINLKYVLKFDHTLIYLEHHQTAYLARRKYTELKQNYQLYLASCRV